VAIDASVPTSADGGSRTPQGSKIDDENNIAVSVDEDEGCSVGRAHGSRTGPPCEDGWCTMAVALCIAKIAKNRKPVHRRGRNRPLFL
jgi:hypothetical protein